MQAIQTTQAAQTTPILIYGLGRSGRGVAKFLANEGLKAEWVDAKPTAEDEVLAAELGLKKGDVLGTYQTVVAAPGVPIDHPDLLALKERGAEIIGEVVLAARYRPQVPMVGITGTAGKGSTTVLIAHLLRTCGLNAKEGGNIDPPLLDIINDTEVAVVELSSFQLERVPNLRLSVAVITNLGIDHLDRHRTKSAYHAAKLNITKGQQASDTLILPPETDVATSAQVLHFNPSHLVLSDGLVITSTDRLPEGIHPANAAAALLATEAMLKHLGRPVLPDVLAHGLETAQPVAGRFETVARIGDIRFIEDSIATRTIAVQAALSQATPPIVWLVGGRDKGAELEPLQQAAAGRVVRVLAFGEDGEKLAKGLNLPYDLVTGNTGDESMENAVAAGFKVLKQGGRGSIVLAPIGTSFDQFKDYKARGNSFKAAALALKHNQETPTQETLIQETLIQETALSQ